MIAGPSIERCPYCGMPLRTIWVHGHGQCAACGTNVDECCRGEQDQLPFRDRTGKPSDERRSPSAGSPETTS
jgi:uncharacterized Zn finger protein (UPF0148 family)